MVTIVAAALGALGLIFILAGPAFHFIPTNVGIFAGLVCWIIGGLIKGLVKKGKKVEKAEKVEKVEEEE